MSVISDFVLVSLFLDSVASKFAFNRYFQTFLNNVAFRYSFLFSKQRLCYFFSFIPMDKTGVQESTAIIPCWLINQIGRMCQCSGRH